MSNSVDRLKEIDAEIAELKERIESLYAQRDDLLSAILVEKTKNLRQFSSRSQNALKALGIDTDEKLLKFLNGNDSMVSKKTTRFDRFHYSRAKTMLQRLSCISNIGECSANEILKILAKNGLI